MKSLNQIRREYEENYQRILNVISEMGGDDRIKEHRKQQSRLYRQLRELQRREHQLDALENRLNNRQTFIH